MDNKQLKKIFKVVEEKTEFENKYIKITSYDILNHKKNNIVVQAEYIWGEYKIKGKKYWIIDIGNEAFLINEKGENVLGESYRDLSYAERLEDQKIFRGLFIAENNKKKYGVIDINNKTIIPFEYTNINIDADKTKKLLFEVTKGKRDGQEYGIVNEKNKTIVPFEYRDIDTYENVIIGNSHKKSTLFDLNGKILLDVEKKWIEKTDNDDLFLIHDSKKKGQLYSLSKKDYILDVYKNDIFTGYTDEFFYNGIKYDIRKKKSRVLINIK